MSYKINRRKKVVLKYFQNQNIFHCTRLAEVEAAVTEAQLGDVEVVVRGAGPGDINISILTELQSDEIVS